MPEGIYKRTTYNPGMFREGAEHRGWVGDAVGYQGVHIWLRKMLGRPNYCEHCKSTKKSKMYDWANI